MKKNNIFDLNYLWMMFVLLHLAGASVVSMADVLPFGSIILLCGICYIVYLYIRKWKYGIMATGIIFAILLLINQYAGAFFRPSYLLNMIQFALIIFIAGQSQVDLIQHVRIKRPSVKQGIVCVLLTASTLCMAMYINSLSMLFSRNFVTDTMQYIAGHEWSAVLILAILPATVEEMMFRGCIYRATSHKIAGVIISAVCFALLHTNVNQICYALFMGLCFGMVIYLTDNLSLTIMMHILFNLYTVVMSIFKDIPWVQKILHMKWRGYQLWNPIYTAGHVKDGILSGAVVFFIAGIITIILFYGLSKLTDKRTCESMKPEDNIWKCDWRFCLATILCMAIAAYWQIFS